MTTPTLSEMARELRKAEWTYGGVHGWQPPAHGLAIIWRDTTDAYAELQRRKAAAEPKPAAFGMDQPWSLIDCLQRLRDAARHLLRDHDCDQHGYEGVDAAIRAADRYLADLSTLSSPEVHPAPAVCRWFRDGAGNWTTECGDAFVAQIDRRNDNRMTFCCYCGLRLVEVAHESEGEDG